MKNWQYLSCLAIVVMLVSCANNETPRPDPNRKSFEGTMIHKVTADVYSGNPAYDGYQKQKFGPTAISVLDHNGNIKRTFPSNGARGVEFFIYRAAENKAYQKFRNIDTIYAADCSKNPLTLVFEKEGGSERSRGTECKSYTIAGIDMEDNQEIEQTYYYPENKEYIDPALYRNYKEFFFGEMIEKARAPYYKLVMHMRRYTMTFVVDSIKPGKIDASAFEVPKGIPIKKFN